MSVNRNVNLIKAIQPIVEREPVKYNFSGSFYAAGGGGGGETATVTHPGGGGGGAGIVVSASLSIVPNITYSFEVGSKGLADNAGESTTIIAYDNDYSSLVTFRAGGGNPGLNGAGGNSGTGSVETTLATASYAGFSGGAETTSGGHYAGGGGAGSFNSGSAGLPENFGGQGGEGADIFGSIAGGGGGGVDTGVGGVGTDGGGEGGDSLSINGTNATKYAAGGGGAGSDEGGPVYGNGGEGGDGVAFILFTGKIGTNLGEFDITTTNASASYNSGANQTTITFFTGSGTFRYTAPFPYIPGN